MRGDTSVYKDSRWDTMRKRALAQSGYQCANCRRYGISRDAEMVHHAYPVVERPDLRYTLWNLVPLCNTCHNKMHNRETNLLTTLGKQWRTRVTPPKF